MTPHAIGNRKYLEDHLIEVVNEIEVDNDSADWVAGENFQRFLDCWKALRRYYEDGDDTVIGTEVVAELIAILRLLRRLENNQVVPAPLKEVVSESLRTLEVVAEETLREAAANAHYDDE
jgi:hypothetical protein